MEEALIDTNILIYAYDEKEIHRRDIARAILLDCWNGKKRFLISTQNLAEFINSSKKINLPKCDALEFVESVLNWPYWKIIGYNQETLKKAMLNEGNIFDNLLLETAIENNARVILTENTKHFKTNKIKVVNPFAR